MTLALPALVVALAACVQAVTGFGFALVAIPLLAVVTGPERAVVSVTAIIAVLAGVVTVRHREAIVPRAAWRYIVTGLLGAPLGLAVLLVVSTTTLTAMVGVVVLLAVVAMALRVRATDRRAQWSAGVLGGVLLTSTGMNGPPIVVGLDGLRLSPTAFRATIQAVFVVHATVAFALFAGAGLVDREVLMLIATYSIALPVGWSVGSKLFDRMHAAQFRVAVLVMLSASALFALGSTL